MFIDMSTCQFDLIFFCEATIYKFNFGKCKINCEQCFLCFLQCVLHLKENLFNSCGNVYSHVRMTILRDSDSDSDRVRVRVRVRG